MCIFRRFQGDHRRPCPTSAARVIADLVKSCLAASGASDQDVWGIYGCIFPWRFQWYNRVSAAMSDVCSRRYRRFLTAAAISARTYVITWDCTHWPLYVGGRGVLKSCSLLTAAALSSRTDVIRIFFSLPMSPSLVCWIGPTAVRKKVAMVPQGRGLSLDFKYCIQHCFMCHPLRFYYFVGGCWDWTQDCCDFGIICQTL
jgi:hypothetical protein